MRVRVLDAKVTLRPFRTRLPFRFGAVTITALDRISLRISAQSESGQDAPGCSADFLVPRWFDKRADRTAAQDVEGLRNSVHNAVSRLMQAQRKPRTVFEHWLDLERHTFTESRHQPDEALTAGFGLALVERALMDATCRLARTDFHTALAGDLFAFKPAELLPELAAWNVPHSLPARMTPSVVLRHTVGFLDALTRNAVQHDPADGLPACLEAEIEECGLHAFKVKLSGNPAQDVQRLCAVAGVIIPRVPRGSLRVTLDANEQYADLDALCGVLQEVRAHADGCRLLEALAFIEQPVARAQCFSAGMSAAIQRCERFAPVLLDEGDSETLAFARARECGWRGVSVKPCKGVFRALLNFGLVARSAGRLFLSAEDLTCPPTVALHQDLALVASLGLPDVEKNAHHYFRGLSDLDSAERDSAFRTHARLYTRSGALVHLAIREGRLGLRDLDAIGFGGGHPHDAEADEVLLNLKSR